MTPLEWFTLGLVVATFALVGITGYYAVQTRQIVDEMRRARAIQVMPRLVPLLKPHHDEATKAILALARIVNVGTGPAFQVAVELATEPGWQTWRCGTPVMMPNEARDFVFTADGTPSGEARLRLDGITQRAFRLRLEGTLEDALGTTYRVNEVVDISKLAEQWKQTGIPETLAGDQPLAYVAARLKEIIGQRPTYS